MKDMKENQSIESVKILTTANKVKVVMVNTKIGNTYIIPLKQIFKAILKEELS